ncbi:MAG TPA: YfiR family protein [Vicinamibacteria bacterium]|nr:YfiR family protein [Vicinamibacteria bacterium]
MAPPRSPRPRSRALLALVLALGSVVPGPARAQAMPFPVDLQVPLLLKILTYDRSFEFKAKQAVTIAVAFDAADPSSVAAKDAMIKTLEQVSGRTIKNLPIKWTAVEFKDAAGFDRAVRASRANVLYVSPGLGDHLAAILKTSRSYAVTTATGVPEFVQRGIAVGIGVKPGNKPDILINLPSSRSEGSEFDASLLRIATVVK